MRRRESGFSLLELMIALAIVAFVLAAASTFFIGVVKQYKIQSKITESNVEGVIGLEILRQDLESLGFGLPWEMNGITYNEPPLGGSTEPPRAIGSVNATDNSDYLILRSARVGMASAAGKWTTLRAGPVTRAWGAADEDLGSGDRVIVLAPGGSNTDQRVLLTPLEGADFSASSLSAFDPADDFRTNIVYGIDNGSLQRPFNRADYYIANNPAYPTPAHCAANTGVLVKAVMAHDLPGTRNLFPLLDCVADLQVVYGLDTDADGGVNEWTDTLGTLTAADLRTQLIEVRLPARQRIRRVRG
jgi:prepilin-type N-terminal cleavage/methylation domain-containing protein